MTLIYTDNSLITFRAFEQSSKTNGGDMTKMVSIDYHVFSVYVLFLILRSLQNEYRTENGADR